jgi:peroxiredoxin
VYGELEHAQLDWEITEMDTIGISPDSVSSTAAFVREKGISLPLLSNPGGSLSKELSIISPKGNMIQGAFIISKSGILLARTTGKQDRILDDLQKVICTLFENI